MPSDETKTWFGQPRWLVLSTYTAGWLVAMAIGYVVCSLIGLTSLKEYL